LNSGPQKIDELAAANLNQPHSFAGKHSPKKLGEHRNRAFPIIPSSAANIIITPLGFVFFIVFYAHADQGV